MKRHLTLLIFCITALISCSKDDESPVLRGGTYSNNGLAVAGPITLYVGDKTITERNFIHSFLERRADYWLKDSTFNEYTGTNIRYYPTSLIIKGDSIAIDTVSLIDKDTFYINTLSNNTKLLVSKRVHQVNPTLWGDLGCANVGKYIRRNPASYHCTYFDYPYYNSSCTGHKQFQLNIENDHIVIPVLTYYFIRPVAPGVNCYTNERYINDDFNTDIQHKLRPEDTLAVQTYFVKLYKQ
ncbi:hypothetical protein [Chitinophaga sp. S165]|uniref:hypothetical protein n=1 Tax=Chitinophaga sp. S165 TaxID=2135462 RepID=UPI000D70C147|nr:hypothetical protein [Chitinophaga sp. S165]PWV47562.1 hypothetical protein C7475_108129 [Chitinophaga sp. S165]